MLRAAARGRWWDVFLIVHIAGFCGAALTLMPGAVAVRGVALWVPLVLMEPGVLLAGRLLAGWHGATTAGLLLGGVVIVLVDAAVWWCVFAGVERLGDRRRRRLRE